MGAAPKPRFLQGYLNYKNMNFIMGQPGFKATALGITIFAVIPYIGLTWLSDNEDFYAENREVYANKRINFVPGTNENPIYKAQGLREYDIARYNSGTYIPQDVVFGKSSPLNSMMKALEPVTQLHVKAIEEGNPRVNVGHGYINSKYVAVSDATYADVKKTADENLAKVAAYHKSVYN